MVEMALRYSMKMKLPYLKLNNVRVSELAAFSKIFGVDYNALFENV